MLVDLTEAENAFHRLPDEMKWPTLSPGYVAADARRSLSLTPLFYVLESRSGVFIHAIHESSIEELNACDWQSAYGYGGPLSVGLGQREILTAWKQINDLALQRRVVAEFVRFHPGTNNQSLYCGTVKADRKVVIVGLTVSDLLGSYSSRARNTIRKGEKLGLEARWQNAEAARMIFPEFYRKCMRELGASAFYFFDDEYFNALFSLTCVKLLAVYLGEHLLSMGLFLFGPRQVEYHLSGTTSLGRQTAATNLLIHHAAVTAQSEGKEWLYLGGGVTSSENDSLLLFKSSFAPARHSFHVGSRILAPSIYQQLREKYPERATRRKVLFYRD